MIVGVPKEIKTAEHRVALVPAGVESLVGDGHRVLVEEGAGIGSGFADEAYGAAGGTLVPKAADVWAKAEMVVKVKEPIEPEWPCMRKGQVVFTYFHFAASEPLTRAVIKSGIVAIAYETVQLPSGDLPLLTPMSEVRSEEHTSELQSLAYLVCRLLLEKKKRSTMGMGKVGTALSTRYQALGSSVLFAAILYRSVAGLEMVPIERLLAVVKLVGTHVPL